MIKITAFDVREDEKIYMEEFARELDIDLTVTDQTPILDNLDLVRGREGVSVLGNSKVDAPLLDAWSKLGVKFLSDRSIGYERIDLPHAHSLGIQVCNAAYAPNGVADFTVMLMLMCLRRCKAALQRGQVGDFSLAGLQGREMRHLTVGVIGTGRIGRTVLQNLSGFGCRLLAYDAYENDEAKALAEYVPLDRLYRESDIITLHIPGSPEARHMIDAAAISSMKDGVILINCARGELADPEALIAGIESGKLGALGLDVMEGEQGIVHEDHRTHILTHRAMACLRQFPNVVMTQHFAFYTDAAVRSMVECGLRGIVSMKQTGTCPTELK